MPDYELLRTEFKERQGIAYEMFDAFIKVVETDGIDISPDACRTMCTWYSWHATQSAGARKPDWKAAWDDARPRVVAKIEEVCDALRDRQTTRASKKVADDDFKDVSRDMEKNRNDPTYCDWCNSSPDSRVV